MMARGTLAALFLTLASYGCAAVPRDAGVRDVREHVRRQSGFDAAWMEQPADPAAAGQRVRELLTQPLSQSSAVEIALLNNEDLRAELEELGIARADLIQAGRPRNPVFEGEIRFPDRPFELHLMKHVLDLVQLPRRRRLAQAEFEQAKLRVADSVLRVLNGVRERFHAVQAEAQTIEGQRAITRSAITAAELALRQHAAGNIPLLALEREQAALEEERIALAAAEERLHTEREGLNVLLGLWGTQTQWEIATSIPEPPAVEANLEGLESRAVARRLDLQLAWRAIEVAARRGRLARTGILEDLEVGLHHEREPEGTSSTGPEIVVPIPLFDPGGASRSRARAELRQAQHRHAALAVAVRSEVRVARNRLLAARARAMYYRDVVLPRRTRILELSQREYNFMLVGVFDLLADRREEIAARREYIEALREYWIARAQLERAIGGPLESSTQDHVHGGS